MILQDEIPTRLMIEDEPGMIFMDTPLEMACVTERLPLPRILVSARASTNSTKSQILCIGVERC